MSTSSEPRSRAGERVGQVLKGRWRLDALIGEGGMAAVYAATHRNGNRVAVKVLHPELARDATMRERFVREGYVANKVGHPGAVRVLDDDTAEDGAAYLVMELLSGQSVADLQDGTPSGRLDEATAVEIVTQLCDVLAAAHAAQVVHRDLKPENLFWTREGQVKVLDFGIARVREAAGFEGSTRRMTQTGSVMGTPAFMPPEQALGEGHRVDARTDIWATGATLFTLLSGRCVHEDDTAAKVLLRAMTRPVDPLSKVAPFVRPELAAVVDRAVAFDPEARWQSARDMGDALRALGPAPARDSGDVVSAPTLHSASDPSLPSGRPLRTVAFPQPTSPGVAAGHHETLVTSSRSTLGRGAKRARWPWMMLGAAALFTAIAIVGWRIVQPTDDVTSAPESTSEAGGRAARASDDRLPSPPAEPTPTPTPTVASNEPNAAPSASATVKAAGSLPPIVPASTEPSAPPSVGATSTNSADAVGSDPIPTPAPPASAKDFSGRF